jgi:PAS domain S-box-containing protein
MHPRLRPYAFTLLGVAAATLVRWALDAVLDGSAPYITFYVTIMAAALLAGGGPGLLATIVSAILGYTLFLHPRVSHFHPTLAEYIRVGMFLGFGTFISLVAGRLRKSEKGARESEERLSLAQSVARAGIWDHDLRAKKNIWSEQYYKIYGLSRDRVEPSYKNWILCVHPEDRDFVDRKGREFFRGTADRDLEFRILRPNGDVRWVRETGRVISDRAGRPYRYRYYDRHH